MGSKPKPAKEDPAAVRLRRQQLTDLAKLDEEENTRIKRLIRVSTGMRLFNGSPDMRLPAGNSRGGPPVSGVTRYTGQSVARLQGFPKPRLPAKAPGRPVAERKYNAPSGEG